MTFKISSTATIDTKEMTKFLDRLRDLNTHEVQYGYFEGDTHQDSGLDIAWLAATLNYGNKNIPARPFMDLAGDMVDRHFQISKKHGVEIWQYLCGVGTIKTLLKQFGRVGETYVQASIDTGEWVDNVEWWKQIKFEKYQQSAPLVASQELYESVKSKVVKSNVILL
jgi:hypothetical protein